MGRATPSRFPVLFAALVIGLCSCSNKAKEEERKAAAQAKIVNEAVKRRADVFTSLGSLVGLVPAVADATTTACPGSQAAGAPEDKLIPHIEYELLRQLTDPAARGDTPNPLGGMWLSAAMFKDLLKPPTDRRSADVTQSSLNAIEKRRYLGVYRRAKVEPPVIEGEIIKKHAHYEGWFFVIDRQVKKLVGTVRVVADSSKELVVDANDVQGSFFRNLQETIEPATNEGLEKTCKPLQTSLVVPTVWFKD
jgi:hypothetical protein